MKFSSKILLFFLIGAVINGCFYIIQKIYFQEKFLSLTANPTGLFKTNQHDFSGLKNMEFYVDSDKELIFTPPSDITQAWTEKYYREHSDREEIRPDWKNIQAYLKFIESSINQDSIDAKLEFSGNKVTAFSLPKNGRVLDIIESEKEILKQAKGGNEQVALITKTIEPNISLDKIDNLGIIGLIGTGESDFSGSTDSRIHNIKTGASTFNGVLLKPGETFSFNNILGDVDELTGYKPELVVKNSKLIPEYGGGLCQVSTTFFRTAVRSGLPILERRPHSLPVRYYNPQGFDATIYPGVTDFRFENDTLGYLLIQTKIQNNKLIIEFYGSPDNRKVEISGPNQYDVKSDGSLKAILTRTVLMPDGSKKEDKFYSNYRSPSEFPRERNPLE